MDPTIAAALPLTALASLSDYTQETFTVVLDTASRGLAYMPDQIARRNACRRLLLARLVEQAFARHEETGAEAWAYVLSLRLVFNAAMEAANLARADKWFRRCIAHLWQRREEGIRLRLPPPMRSTCDGPQIAQLAVWHADAAAFYRHKGEEDMVHGHALTVFALRALAGGV